MTNTIDKPAAHQIQNGDEVTLSHRDLPKLLVLKYDGGFTLPGLNQKYTAAQITAAGYTFESLERTKKRDEIEIVGEIKNGTLTVSAVLPSGASRRLSSVYVGGRLDGKQSAVITKADFDA